MPDYRALYFKLFAVHCDVVEMLSQAGQEAEDIATQDGKNPIDLFHAAPDGDNKDDENEPEDK